MNYQTTEPLLSRFYIIFTCTKQTIRITTIYIPLYM